MCSAKWSVQIRPFGFSAPVWTSNGTRRVELVGLVPLRRVVAEALPGDRVHDHRAAELLRLLEGLLHRGPVVAVDGSDVLEAEVLEQALRRECVLEALLHRVERVVGGRADGGDGVDALLDQLEDLLVARVGAQPGERVGEATDRRRVGAPVVVDDHHQPRVAGDGDVVEGLPGHAARERAVADHRDDVAVLAADGVGLGDAVGVAERGRSVRVLDDVVLGLGLARVAAHPALAAQGAELRDPPGHELVDVGLVSGVEDDPVARAVEHPVDGQGQLDDAEVGPEVTGVRGDRPDQQVADLARERRQLVLRQVPQVAGRGDAVEKGHRGEFRRSRHGDRDRRRIGAAHGSRLR